MIATDMSESRGRGMKQRAHVLVVDDQADNLLILEDVLSEHYDVHPANNGVEALGFLEAGGSADLILLDVMMPGESGTKFAARLRGGPEPLRSAPILMLTAMVETKDRIAGLEELVP